jgi:hypothetical protein
MATHITPRGDVGQYTLLGVGTPRWFDAWVLDIDNMHGTPVWIYRVLRSTGLVRLTQLH